ncbi:MAG: GtrA family protein [Clostridium sp.]|nr:GtrA family protein [Clostridium sp.]
MKNLRAIGDKVLNSDRVEFAFLRSAVSSQTASWVDLFLGFALFAWVGLAPWLSTAIGAVAGGVVNCIINYKFTFHANDCPWRAVIVKYVMVWFGSMSLNSFGTQTLYWAFSGWDYLREIGFNDDGTYAAARLLVSLLVSWFWNFLLQHRFVYRVTSFDPTAIAISRVFFPWEKDER